MPHFTCIRCRGYNFAQKNNISGQGHKTTSETVHTLRDTTVMLFEHYNTVKNMTIARQQFGNTRSREQTQKSIASQRLAKHIPAATDKTDQYTNCWRWRYIFGSPESWFSSGEFSRKRIVVQFNSVQFSSREFNHSTLEREFNVQLWSVNQRTTETKEVTDS
jgi:hypothetical protein